MAGFRRRRLGGAARPGGHFHFDATRRLLAADITSSGLSGLARIPRMHRPCGLAAANCEPAAEAPDEGTFRPLVAGI